MIPVTGDELRNQIEAVKDLILSEVNVKKIEYLADTSEILVKKIKPNFKSLGPRYGKRMKEIAGLISKMNREDISQLEKENKFILHTNEDEILLGPDDVEIISEDIPGWLVANEGQLTTALDVTLTPELKSEGIARELVNRIQNLRKDSGFEVTDKIMIRIEKNIAVSQAIAKHEEYISTQTLATTILISDRLEDATEMELEENMIVKIRIEKTNHTD